MLSNLPLPIDLHPLTLVSEVTIGSGPLPYAPITIGELDEPEADMRMVPTKVSPRRKYTLSPGRSVEKTAFNLSIDLQGVLGF